MVIENIFDCAHRSPGRTALYYGFRPISYAAFAFWISRARAYLSPHGLQVGSLAILDTASLLDAWVFGFALRSLGITTISVPSHVALNDLNLRNVGCAITTRGRSLQNPQTIRDFKLIEIPEDFYLALATDGIPELLRNAGPSGGHILLTSGTTGVSKKVLIDGTQLANSIPRRAGAFGFSGRSILNVSDYGIWTSVGYSLPLCTWSLGGAVAIYQGAGIHRSLGVDGLTHTFFNPTILSAILSAPAQELRRHETMQLFVGGSRLSPSMADEIRKFLTPNIFAIVSSTETGSWAKTRIDRPEDLRSHCILPSCEVQIVDEADIPLPTGQTGAVRIRAAGSATGYVDDEEASRLFFRDGYFYSGDLGTIGPDGRLVLRGRANNVLNLGGSKVAAETIELAIQESLAVEEVCVLSWQNEAMNDEFHVVVQSRRHIGKSELASAIRAHLPGADYARVHFVDAVPRGNSGKIDRAALRRQVFGART